MTSVFINLFLYPPTYPFAENCRAQSGIGRCDTEDGQCGRTAHRTGSRATAKTTGTCENGQGSSYALGS